MLTLHENTTTDLLCCGSARFGQNRKNVVILAVLFDDARFWAGLVPKFERSNAAECPWPVVKRLQYDTSQLEFVVPHVIKIIFVIIIKVVDSFAQISSPYMPAKNRQQECTRKSCLDSSKCPEKSLKIQPVEDECAEPAAFEGRCLDLLRFQDPRNSMSPQQISGQARPMFKRMPALTA
ncbi:uncharacterized protein B0I36DRAFT_15315 [Microdochium trichocladiopsis]|uniref:Uncharacterized protein n=1 Tax=Microdochium trichocladiopsis TaxID=1682393 RepID=A0A9P8YFG2_9PEZI|nr:uncharacterized protein B0I36DRAFT_15315 [Microdochium trichocladiopsis]KAH7040787.1 hypothetical protein B0I36DRAFT_15315 [Microdochium trichocladiopsis]